jgi:hypothetical protein
MSTKSVMQSWPRLAAVSSVATRRKADRSMRGRNVGSSGGSSARSHRRIEGPCRTRRRCTSPLWHLLGQGAPSALRRGLCAMLAGHMREAFPITRPREPEPRRGAAAYSDTAARKSDPANVATSGGVSLGSVLQSSPQRQGSHTSGNFPAFLGRSIKGNTFEQFPCPPRNVTLFPQRLHSVDIKKESYKKVQDFKMPEFSLHSTQLFLERLSL